MTVLREPIVAVSLASFLAVQGAPAGDWPMWRYDAGRTAITPDELPTDLHLQWIREFPRPRPAWPRSQRKLQFDASYEPVVAGTTIFVPSMASDSVTAYDTRTGEEKWRFYTDGPVRFAPVAHNDALYFASDDGYLYCLSASEGSLLWRFRAGPSNRKIIGNDRLISMWPARGAPVIHEGVVYFAGGIWPFMGTFIHALDAHTGKAIWCNSGSGSEYTLHQHNSYSFGGVAPQGYIAATEEKLLVSGGRTVPACYDRRTGNFEYFHMASREFGKDAGGYAVSVVGPYFLNGGCLYRLEDGGGVAEVDDAFCTPDACYYFPKSRYDLTVAPLEPVRVELTDKKGNEYYKGVLQESWAATLGKPVEKLFLKAGKRLYGSTGKGELLAIDVFRNESASVSWAHRIETMPRSMLAADDRLFAVTDKGRLYCFGAEKTAPATFAVADTSLSAPADRWAALAKGILKNSDTSGYCVALGLGSGRLVEEIVRHSLLHVIVIEGDRRKANDFRERMDACGLYGRRIAVIAADSRTMDISPYMATLVVSENPVDLGDAHRMIKRIFELLRPYGGSVFFPVGGDNAAARLKGVLREADLEKAEVTQANEFVILRRSGGLRGSSGWTHQYADAANTVVSRDSLVKAPLGLLWFGGPPNDPVLPRHGHGPSPQVVGGSLFIEGRDLLRAVDVYTGRLLWERELSGIGEYYDNTRHHPGANEIGGNFVSMEDGIYVVAPSACLLLDPKTGRTIREFLLPRRGDGPRPHWGWITVSENLLIASVSPLEIRETTKKKKKSVNVKNNASYGPAGTELVVMDRFGGEVLWSRKAVHNFRHNAIVAGSNVLFCIDGMSPKRSAAMKRRGVAVKKSAMLYALEADTGEVVWQTDENIFGTWLGYSEKRDILLQAGSRERDRADDEVGEGMTAFRGRDGSVLWQSDVSYRGPCLLWRDAIITQSGSYGNGFAVDLLTGRMRMKENPITGESEPWFFTRNYGCNTAIGSEHILAFRSGAAGFVNLDENGGTGNLGGFKSGCTSSLIPADGVLSAPDYTRTCKCSYQNQSSLAMIHMPEVETWTISGRADNRKEKKIAARGLLPVEVRRIGINLGAPGDRLAEDGTLWLDYPGDATVSPDIPVYTKPQNPKWFRMHSSLVEGEGAKWVAASGGEGVEVIKMTLSAVPEEGREYTVRLHFLEPERKPKSQIFSVSIQGEEVLSDFDVVKEAAGPLHPLVKEFTGITVKDKLTIRLVPEIGDTLISGVEIVAED